MQYLGLIIIIIKSPDDELWTIEQFLEKNEEACRFATNFNRQSLKSLIQLLW